jgi:TetR/AcrR family transcriptional repressor of nem operon
MSDTRETIMAAARLTVQAHGYNGLSFRELAKEIGIKSASIHYHFPTKGDLGAALARRYCEDAKAAFEGFWAESPDPAICLRKYTDIFRLALENENRMCLCGFMAAEYLDLPEAVKVEVQAFAGVNVAWLAKVLSSMDRFSDPGMAEARALAIYAAIGGAQLTARSRADISVYDKIVESYRVAGLIPGRCSPGRSVSRRFRRTTDRRKKL